MFDKEELIMRLAARTLFAGAVAMVLPAMAMAPAKPTIAHGRTVPASCQVPLFTPPTIQWKIAEVEFS